MSLRTEVKALRRFSTGRVFLLVVAFAVILASVTAGMLIWRDGKIDYRVAAPMFGSEQGDFDCSAGLSTVMDSLDIHAAIQGEADTCSTSFENPSAHVATSWNYTIQVERSQFDTNYGHFRSLEDSRDADECTLFPYGFTGISRYIDGQGGFCVIRSSDPSYRESKEITSKILLARFGEQVEANIMIRLPQGADYTSPERTMPFSQRNYLEYRTAKAFAAQLDPTGMVGEQLSQYAPFNDHSLDLQEKELKKWCPEIPRIDVGSIANTDAVPFLEYEADLVDDTDWWMSTSSDEIHCSATWTIKVRNEAEPGSSEIELLGQAAGLSITPWPWGTEMPEGGAGIESGRINCTRVVLESLESDLTDVEIEHFDGIGPVKRCGAEGEQTELVFLLETASFVFGPSTGTRRGIHSTTSDGTSQSRTRYSPLSSAISRSEVDHPALKIRAHPVCMNQPGRHLPFHARPASTVLTDPFQSTLAL